VGSSTGEQRTVDERNTALADRIGSGCFRLGVLALWAYAFSVLPFARLFSLVDAGAPNLTVAFGIGCVAIIAFPYVARVRRLSPTRLLELGIASIAIVISLLAADLAIAVRDNGTRAKAERFTAQEARDTDHTLWHGELYPRMYTPAGQSFSLYKPNVRLTGDTYGQPYVSAMLASKTLVESVLEPRRLSYFIGPEGLRELDSLAGSRIFALGDSFVFGFATDEGKVWPDLLAASLGEPVFNLGVSATGPRRQLELLKYMMRTHPDTMHVRQLLWMIFEGNDLEDSYSTAPLAERPTSRTGPFDGTVIETVLELPAQVRNQSVIGKVLRGELTLAASRRRYGQYQIDGVDLPLPVFHSQRFGYRLFVGPDTTAATQPREYVLNHPNRPRLDQTFHEMRSLSQKSGFAVTVIIAPSDARLYGAAYDGFPALSAEPYFIDYVARLAGDMGFAVVNLLPLLRPFADNELLYYRDDHHWNVRGNAIAAQLIAKALAGH
jgi:hypothetical protein